MSEEYVTKAQHEEFKERLDAENERQNHRINKLESTIEKINDLAISTNELATTMKSMLEEQKNQGKRLSELESRDGKKWRDVVKTVIAVAVTAVVTAAMIALGFK